MSDENFTYDVFISHSSADREAVLELAERLKRDNVRVWLDLWEIKPGDLVSLKIERGLEQSRTLLLVMSAAALASDWVTLERHTALFRDPTNSRRRFIPLRLDNAPLKDTLKQFSHIDWRHRSPTEYAALLSACRLQITVGESVVKNQESQTEKVLRGHEGAVFFVNVTPDGRRAISGSNDTTARIWDVETGQCLTILKHTNKVRGVAISADGRRAISGSWDNKARVWDVDTGRCLAVLKGHTDYVIGVAITSDGRLAVSGSNDGTVRLWDVDAGQCRATLEEQSDGITPVALTPDGQRVASGDTDGVVWVWDVQTGQRLAKLEGHSGLVEGIGITADGRRVVSSSWDSTVRVWDIETAQCLAVLKGHIQDVEGIALTPDGRRAVSCGEDKTLRVWDVEAARCIAILEGHESTVWGVAITPDGRRAVSCSDDQTLRVWELPPYEEKATEEVEAEVYTNAKVLLVGDSGVGKSGLAWRLTENKFEATVSTDAAWATQLKLPHETSSKEIEREIWLWDFAGQADYRLIHQLFMDETALAVLVFNPQSENPFEGLGQWDRDLQRAARRSFRKLLVAGRCDRGGLMVSRAAVEKFIGERGFDSYLETSAFTGDGCDALREAIVRSIPWGEIPWTSSPRIFKLLKEEIIRLKDEGKVLLRVGELKQQLEMRLAGEPFTLEQLRAVVGLLAGPGVVWKLEFGDFVLLQPERINAYAAAVIRSVRAHTDEIGCIPEERVLAGDLDYQKAENQRMERLPPDEEQIVLRAMHQILVDHSICLREHTEAGPLLVFPSYFKRERPDQPDHPTALVTYQFSGMLDEIYATLVVKLRHTAAFNTDERWLWRFAADFRTQAGRRVGFYMKKKSEGAAELTVYCEPATDEDTKVTFIRYIHDHLKSKDPEVVRVRHYVCQSRKCGEPVADARAVQKAIEARRRAIRCQYCDKQIIIADLIEEKFASERIRREVRELEEHARRSIDKDSRELILFGHAFAIAAEAGQFFRQASDPERGFDAEIEFKDRRGEPSGQRVYLQLRYENYYEHARTFDKAGAFYLKNPRHAEQWRSEGSPVMLVTRAPDGRILWMDVAERLRRTDDTRVLFFEGEPFTALSLVRLRDRLFPLT